VGRGIARLALLSICGLALGSAACPAGAVVPRGGETRALESSLLAEINGVRQEYGLRPLTVAGSLSAAAREHSLEMVTRGYFGHSSANGMSCDRRIARYYPMGRYHRWLVGENLLQASPDIDAARALSMWMSSPDHRANILDRSFRQIGLSAVHVDSAPGDYNGNVVTVITADFGMRR
jgi:uncharacterized protein YkwD